MKNRLTGLSLLVALALSGGPLVAQTMKPKYDQKCLEDAGKAYIACMANATSEPAKEDCTKQKVAAEKKCKL